LGGTEAILALYPPRKYKADECRRGDRGKNEQLHDRVIGPLTKEGKKNTQNLASENTQSGRIKEQKKQTPEKKTPTKKEEYITRHTTKTKEGRGGGGCGGGGGGGRG